MKRHTSQNARQLAGEYFTKNADDLLAGYSDLLRGKRCLDPFAGEGDLLDFALSNGAASVHGYDIRPRRPEHEQRDTLFDPPEYAATDFILTNPPYLSSNKDRTGYKAVYERYGHSDLYKCALASFMPWVDEGILILPSNFLSESSPRARSPFFDHYEITRSDYYYRQVFPDATTGIVVLHFRRSLGGSMREFPVRLHYEDRTEDYVAQAWQKHDWLCGHDFFEYIDLNSDPIVPLKWTGREEGFLSNIVLSLLDRGRYPSGLSFNEGAPVVCAEKAFTTYQLVFPWSLSEARQRALVARFNEVLGAARHRYHGLFLANYMGAEQKILGRSLVNRLITRVLRESEG